MKRSQIIICILGMILLVSGTAIAAGVRNSQQDKDSDEKTPKKELKSNHSITPTQNTRRAGTTYIDPKDGKERTVGYHTTVVVPTPPPAVYHYPGYRRGYLPPYYVGYRTDTPPWGYEGPPVIATEDGIDSALVWDKKREGFRWDPITPGRTRMSGPVVNPNFRPKPVVVRSQSTASDGDQPEALSDDSLNVQVHENGPVGSWQRRALVSKIDRTRMQLTVITSEGPFVIDAKDAAIVKGKYWSTFDGIAEGDSIRIWAELIGLNKYVADWIEITSGTGDTVDAELKEVKVKGKIIYIDYASFTIKVKTESGEYRILADEETRISFATTERKAFQRLRIGQTVSVTGIGNLTSGYAAREIIITEDADTGVKSE